MKKTNFFSNALFKTALFVIVFSLGVFSVYYFFGQAESEAPEGESADRESPEDDVLESLETAPSVGALAPDFSLQDLKGQEIMLQEYRGRTIILNFWTTTCPYCIDEMPLMEALHLSDPEIAVLAVNVREGEGRVKSFIEEKELTFPVLLDTKANVAGDYLVRAFPTTYVVNAEGVIAAVKIGAFFDEEGLAQLVESARNN
ncbi:TlpA family protein disulfide reductase [Candidatus Contubernalis alkaliaceticus]|uniref:TlpA family protein disulfide reductase n=1 Tax=Candidatus Contubernalis alkaliaceticus TaxID=338645 RepID=UPI001F4BF01F|nr:TlpA disulfide reductase family protein [Candidatus Contubernalis alkalaceticus]UNC93087.1 TlpA family protein disulfide reductase [Candidatus Contubernalis alkalaceticus]